MNRCSALPGELKNIGTGLLAEGKTIRIKAHGYSMYPAIKPGSVILIEPLRLKGAPRVGEIVAIEREKGIIVHRIIKIVEEGGRKLYVARGDSNAYADAPVTIDKIPGRLTSVEGFAPLPEEMNKKPVYFINRMRVIMIQLYNIFRNQVRKIIKR